MKRAAAAVGVLCAVVYMKLFLPGFAEEVVPLMRDWLAMEQIMVTLPEEAITWLILP